MLLACAGPVAAHAPQTLEDYKTVTHEKLTMMASEIDDKDSLHSSYSLGYKTYGTGGFMGDSEKVWSVTETKFSASACQCVQRRGGCCSQASLQAWL